MGVAHNGAEVGGVAHNGRALGGMAYNGRCVWLSVPPTVVAVVPQLIAFDSQQLGNSVLFTIESTADWHIEEL